MSNKILCDILGKIFKESVTMSEPVKKSKKTPESFSPKKPEIVSMMDEAGNKIAQQTVTESGLIDFEIVKFGPYRFIGKSVYSRPWDCGKWNPRDFIESQWEKSEPIFKILDEMKEYASDIPYNAGLRHWEIYNPDAGVTHWEEVFFRTQNELLGSTVGRFMKADTPVPNGMNSVDIHEMYVAKAWMKGEPKLFDNVCTVVEELMYHEVKKHGYNYVPMFSAEICPIADQNGTLMHGSYIACKPMTDEEKAKENKEE